jgi:3-hydroxyisobutyrate dehydrogenase-like beta-hydroxyacid dehydrogenase
MVDRSLCVVGFGELGSVFASRMVAAGVPDVRGFARPGTEPRATATTMRMRAVGARACSDLADALSGAGVVLSAVPAAAAEEVVGACAPLLEPGALYVDVTASEPEGKAAAAALVARHGALYADVAVLGTVVASGYAVPMIVSGPGADAWREFATPLGMSVTTLDGPAGRASLVKLLRSVYMKGRDALVVETLLAARRHGVERELLPTIAGPGEDVSFPALAERVLCALAVHAQRRADELAGSAELLSEVGVDPLVTSAAAARLQWLADLGLRELFDGERPHDLRTVLDAIDRLSASSATEAAGWRASTA